MLASLWLAFHSSVDTLEPGPPRPPNCPVGDSSEPEPEPEPEPEAVVDPAACSPSPTSC